MRHTDLSLKLVVIAVAMFGFGFALAPIYAVFCEITGLGGKTSAVAESVVDVPPGSGHAYECGGVTRRGGLTRCGRLFARTLVDHDHDRRGDPLSICLRQSVA